MAADPAHGCGHAAGRRGPAASPPCSGPDLQPQQWQGVRLQLDMQQLAGAHGLLKAGQASKQLRELQQQLQLQATLSQLRSLQAAVAAEQQHQAHQQQLRQQQQQGPVVINLPPGTVLQDLLRGREGAGVASVAQGTPAGCGNMVSGWVGRWVRCAAREGGRSAGLQDMYGHRPAGR